jgi:hypothetical protein
MIKTTYVLLKKAAEILNTDEDTLLIAAIERRVKLFGFLGEALEALCMTPDTSKTSEYFKDFYRSTDQDTKWFDFVPLNSRDAADIFREGFCSIDVLSEPGADGSYWSIDDSEFESLDIENYPKVLRKNIFLKHTDVEAIKAKAQLPEPHTLPTPPIRKSAATKAADTYLVIIAALAKKAGINIHEAGAANKIRRELDLLGIPMTEGTIYTKVVEVLPEVLADIPDAIGRKQKTTPKQ